MICDDRCCRAFLCGACVDAGDLWWRVNGGEIVTAFHNVALVKEGVYPCLVTDLSSDKLHHVTVNLGSSPFMFTPPEQYLGLEGRGCVR